MKNHENGKQTAHQPMLCSKVLVVNLPGIQLDYSDQFRQWTNSCRLHKQCTAFERDYGVMESCDCSILYVKVKFIIPTSFVHSKCAITHLRSSFLLPVTWFSAFAFVSAETLDARWKRPLTRQHLPWVNTQLPLLWDETTIMLNKIHTAEQQDNH